MESGAMEGVRVMEGMKVVEGASVMEGVKVAEGANVMEGVKVADGSGTREERAVARERLVCPPGHVRVMDNFLRPLLHRPRKLFGPYVREGMTVLDVGCGGGFASMGLAELVGEGGRVIAADLQPEMLAMVKKRARETGLADRVRIHRCNAYGVGLRERLDFALAFWMVHEVVDLEAFLAEMYGFLRPGGHFFVAEPRVHVTRADFEDLIEAARRAGFTVADLPRVSLSRAVVLSR
ncbi:MAG: class I SAM-dependent methyltransferase [Actinobacteria bacterium]|nr:class I SAM-dependent methyltransferase [Actinomycetota bacterium]